jgi:hypothetical protein
MLLNRLKRATRFGLKTLEKFQELSIHRFSLLASKAIGLLDDDKEWINAF